MSLTKQERYLLFLIGCMGSRYMLTFIAKNNTELLPLLAKITLIPAIGFIIIYLFGLRKVGFEVSGEQIWWNNLRPVHGVLWLLFSYLAMNKNKNAWIILFIDTTFGLLMWANHHGFTQL